MNYFDYNARKAGVDLNKTDVIQLSEQELAQIESAGVITVEEQELTPEQTDIWLKNFNR